MLLYSFFKLGARWRWVVNTMSRPLYFREEARCPLYKKLGGSQARSERVEKILPPPGLERRTFPARRESLRYASRQIRVAVCKYFLMWLILFDRHIAHLLSKEIPCLSGNAAIHYRVRISPPMDLIVG